MNKMNYSQDIIDRFWEKVDIPKDLTQCWEWSAYTNNKDYGKFGLIPNGLFICHKCDNPSCINPSHLFLGTQQDNLQDMVQKERSCKGSKNNTDLIESQVEQILIDIWNHKYSNINQICQEYNIGQTTIKSILYGRTWTHITNNLKVSLSDITNIVIGDFNKSGSNNGRSKLTEDDVRNIRYNLLKIKTSKIIANMYNVSKSTIDMIRQNKTWIHV